jgi:hypothetical protein
MTPSRQITSTTPANVTFTAPGCDDLPVYHTGEAMVSTWELTPNELAEIQRTGRVHLVVYGRVHPPVLIAAHEQHVSAHMSPPAEGPAN